MKALWTVFHQILQTQRTALLRGAALSFVVLAMGVALLGLSGWFITAAAAAGLAGMGAVFDVFRPSAMVRFLALGRAAARYFERILTHDATLRALEALRLQVLTAYLTAPHRKMIHIRGAQALHRLTTDIETLDGVPLRLILPLIAGVAAQVCALIALWILVTPAIALWIVGGYCAGAALIFWRLARVSVPLSIREARKMQAFRGRLIDLIRARRDLAVYGRLPAHCDSVLRAETQAAKVRLRLDLAERRAGAALGALTTLVTAGALGLGVAFAQAGVIGAAFASLGVFAALALAETVMPLRRAASDLGRMMDAARRVQTSFTQISPPPAAPPAPPPARPLGNRPAQTTALVFAQVGVARPDTRAPLVERFSLIVASGQTVAMTGPSGAGKSTLLLAAARLHPVCAGRIALNDTDITDLPEPALRAKVMLLPQRSALMAGSIKEALRLAAPVDDAQLWQALEAVQLAKAIRARGGLSAQIGPHGDALSGGEARRLVLARAILRRPDVLLLDEPTEGLDAQTAALALAGVRAALPDAAILIAAHRAVEVDVADRVIKL